MLIPPPILLAILIVILICVLQLTFFIKTRKALYKIDRFFVKGKKFATVYLGETLLVDPKSADEGSWFAGIIKSINEYIVKNHGNVDFAIIQNRTERVLESRFEEATSRISFPVYIGLMGTFMGTGLGLAMFYLGIADSIEGIDEESISRLILGVIISMTTSLFGLIMTTVMNHNAATTRERLDEAKNRFYDFLQEEMLPTLGVGIVAAMDKVHKTISQFEPAFQNVIQTFGDVFDRCAGKFDTAFERNVDLIASSIRTMNSNMGAINENVALNRDLIKAINAKSMQLTLDKFIKASNNFGIIEFHLESFLKLLESQKESHIRMLEAERDFNESLHIPQNVAEKLVSILDRITEFENGVNALGKELAKSKVIGDNLLETVRMQLSALDSKREILDSYVTKAEGELKGIYKAEYDAIERTGKKAVDMLQSVARRNAEVLEKAENGLETRTKAILDYIDKKFCADELKTDLSSLKRLDNMERMLGAMDKKIASLNATMEGRSGSDKKEDSNVFKKWFR